MRLAVSAFARRVLRRDKPVLAVAVAGLGLVAAFAGATIAPLSSAQPPQPPPPTPAPQAPQPTFRTEANYVRVDVYPTRSGVPVADLTQADFDILEDRAPQKIEQ